MRYAAILLCLICGSVSAAEPEVDTARIAQLIEHLDSPDYAIRSRATKQLERIGKPAIPALQQAADDPSAERSVRALSVLERFYLSQDVARSEAASEALDALAASKSNTVAARTRQIFIDNPTITQMRMLRKINKLGGVIIVIDPVTRTQMERLPNLQQSFGRPAEPYVVRIGPAWQGGDEGLALLHNLPQLSVVYLIDGHGASDEALAELRKEIGTDNTGKSRIVERGPCFLGVVAADERNCQIAQVSPGSTADKGGMRPGDVVLSFDGTPVKIFNDLTAEIRKATPGDKVPIVVQRGGQKLDLMLVMQSWSQRPK